MQKVDFRDNSFDYVRMVSAVVITIGHISIHLNVSLGIVANVLHIWIGLYCLFALSGFLIPYSIEHSQNAFDFFKDVLRI